MIFFRSIPSLLLLKLLPSLSVCLLNTDALFGRSRFIIAVFRSRVQYGGWMRTQQLVMVCKRSQMSLSPPVISTYFFSRRRKEVNYFLDAFDNP